VTLGYNELGGISGVSVDARELRDAKGASVRGVLVEVTQSQYREERAFIDVDELPELLKGIDALMAVRENPTQFTQFEVRYTTKGELQITAFNNSRGQIQYAVKAGRVTPAHVFTDAEGVRLLRTQFEKAQQILSSPAR